MSNISKIFSNLHLLNGKFLVSDIASAKEKIGKIGIDYFGNRFVSSHPIAGSEKSGLGTIIPNLFKVGLLVYWIIYTLIYV